MSRVTFTELQHLDQTGQYYRIRVLLKDDPRNIEQFWFLAEAFFRLSEIERLGDLLKLWEKRILTTIDWFRWHYYYSHFLLEHEAFFAALQSVEQQVGFLQQKIDDKLKARILLQQAICYKHLAKFDKSTEILDSLIAKGEKFSDKQTLGRALTTRGEIYFKQDLLKQAEDDCKTAHGFAKELGNPHDMARALSLIGSIYERKGALTLALRYHEEALELKQATGNLRDIGQTFAYIGGIYQKQGFLNRALISYNRAITNFEMIGSKKLTMIPVLDKIASVYNRQGQLGKAATYYEKVVLSCIDQDEDMLARALANLAVIFSKQGRLNLAETINKWSLAIFRKFSDKERLMLSLRIMKTIYQSGEQLEKALNYANELLAVCERSRNRKAIVAAVFDVAYILFRLNLLDSNSDTITRYPLPPYESRVEEGYRLMIQALLDWQKNDWESVEKNLNSVLNVADFSLDDLVLCHELLSELIFIKWRNEQSDDAFIALSKQLEKWLAYCENNKLSGSLCKVYLLKVKLMIFNCRFEDARDLLERVIDHSRNTGLPLHELVALDEQNKLVTELSSENTESREKRLQSGEEQVQQLLSYLTSFESILAEKERLLRIELSFEVPSK